MGSMFERLSTYEGSELIFGMFDSLYPNGNKYIFTHLYGKLLNQTYLPPYWKCIQHVSVTNI